VNEDKEKEELFLKGLEAYHNGHFFDAHEYWEDLWSDYYLKDRLFVQGLIQLSVSFVHLENGNLKGARSLMRKCTEKFEKFHGIHRGIHVNNLLKVLNLVRQEYEKIETSSDFNFELIPELI
jgi:hypothetical protein